MVQKLSFLVACGGWFIAQCLANSRPIRLEMRSEVTSRLANIHVVHSEYVPGLITFTYGTCTAESQHGIYHVITKAESVAQESRLVWAIPQDSPPHGCLAPGLR